MVEIFKLRIQTLLENKEHDTMQTQTNDDAKTTSVDYALINKYSTIALQHGKEWDDLSFVHNTILTIALEKLKEPDETEQDNMQRISDMYYIRKQLMIQEMVEHDENMLDNGVITIDDESGEVDLTSLTKTPCREEVTNEEPTGERGDLIALCTQENENITEYGKKQDLLVNEMDDEATYSNSTSMSLAASAAGIQETHNVDNDKKQPIPSQIHYVQ